MIQNKRFLMTKALMQARIASKRNEVPIGAIVVDENGAILARGYNKTEAIGCQTGHAEVVAIQKACKKRDSWRLNGCFIYVTLEPCLMCLGLIMLSRIDGVIFGATSDLFGSGLGNIDKLPSYAQNIHIEGGVRAQESIQLLQDFFKQARKKRKVSSEATSKFYKKSKTSIDPKAR